MFAAMIATLLFLVGGASLLSTIPIAGRLQTDDNERQERFARPEVPGFLSVPELLS
jgi:hypothetical protein